MEDYMKDKKIILILTPILCLLVSILSYITIINKGSDSVKFKKEYESLNGKVNSSNSEYAKLDISSNNPMKYSDYDEIIDIIKTGTGIIYLGFPECPWCRAALPVLLDVAKQNEVETIYYLNIKNDRDSYVVEDGELIYALDDDGNKIKGKDGYFKLLDALDEHLSDYVIEFEEEIYDVGEKRIYAPSVIFVKNGYVTHIQVSTVATHLNPYESLTDEQYNELYSTYEDEILNIYSDTCSDGTAC